MYSSAVPERSDWANEAGSSAGRAVASSGGQSSSSTAATAGGSEAEEMSQAEMEEIIQLISRLEEEAAQHQPPQVVDGQISAFSERQQDATLGAPLAKLILNIVLY